MTTATAPKCPHCNLPLRSGTEGRRKVWACLEHGIQDPETRQTQIKLPGLDRGKQTVLVKEKEEPVMQRIIRTLRGAGYNVLSTVHRRRIHTCTRCAHSEGPRGGLGTDPGVPDLLVWRSGWRVFLGMEVKGPETSLNDAQKSLQDAGVIVVVRSEAEALGAVRLVDEKLKETNERKLKTV